MYRVFVHVYIHHFDKLVSVGAVRVVSCYLVTVMHLMHLHCYVSLSFKVYAFSCFHF